MVEEVKQLKVQVEHLKREVQTLRNTDIVVSKEDFLEQFEKFYVDKHSKDLIDLISTKARLDLYKVYKDVVERSHNSLTLAKWLSLNYYLITFEIVDRIDEIEDTKYIDLEYGTHFVPIKGTLARILRIEKIDYIEVIETYEKKGSKDD